MLTNPNAATTANSSASALLLTRGAAADAAPHAVHLAGDATETLRYTIIAMGTDFTL